MQVLIRPKKLSAGMLAVAALAGCSRGTSEYRHIEDLPYSEWVSYAETLPLGTRLNLHKEILNRDGPNPKMTIISAFDSVPYETYHEITRRIADGDDSRYYLSVLYEINRSEHFSICAQSDRRVVQRYLWRIATNAVQPEHRPDFYRC